ncbi:MAG: cadherin-like domain-containing protein [Akkermansiaceae bacterium]|nr:cadherin-like domain-containing protein [Akkermansiaceae bacterium]
MKHPTGINPTNRNHITRPGQSVPPKEAGSCGWYCGLAMAVLGLSAHGGSLVPVTNPINYGDGRPYPSYRMDAVDQGKFLDYGQGPNQCDYLGAREALINYVNGKYYLYYDGAGPDGWVACLAESTDLTTWDLKGPVIDFGAPGTADSACACSPWIIQDDSNLWHMYYLGTPNTTGGADKVPIFPYLTLHATGTSPAGPWTKHYSPVPFATQGGTYYSTTASPGHVVKQGGEYLMLISTTDSNVKRTISIARTTDLNGEWTVDPTPALPVTEQIENSSLYYEPTNQTWFMFTNHIGAEAGVEFGTDAVWVYWTKDLNVWNPACKAIVLDGSNCNWSSKCIGMPSVVQVGDELKIFYDAPGGTSTDPMRRSLGMATLQLPLDFSLVSGSTVPVQNGSFETPGTAIGGPWAMFGDPWPLTGLPSTYQQMQAVSGDAFTSTVADGGTWAALISTDDVPLAHPLVQNLPRSVTAGDALAVTFWLGRAKNTTGGQGVAYFDVAGTKYSTTFDTTSLPADSWQSTTLIHTIANSGNLSLGFYGTTTANSWLDKISDVTVTPASVDPDAPSSSGAELTVLEDTATALAAGNLGYSDPNSIALAEVQVTSLPVLGTLMLNGTPVSSGALPLTVLADNISSLTYQSASNGNGTPYTTLGIKVRNANDLWSNYALMTFHVTPVSDAPGSTGSSVILKEGTIKTFAATDFPFSDVDTGDTLGAIRVTSLPTDGTLKLNGTPITSVSSAAIPVANIGTLTYTPALNYIGLDSFKFQVRDATAFSADATMSITVNSALDILVTDGSFETLGDWGPAGTWASINTVWNASAYPYARTYDSSFFTSAADGTWFANFTDPGNTVTQDLLTTVDLGETLSVTFYGGREISGPGGVFTATFLVGTTAYSQTFDTATQASDTWVPYTFTTTIANAGDLSIQFKQVSGRPWVDNISKVTVTTGSGFVTYAAWADTNGATGQAMELDHDNDGVSNGIEYFLGGSGDTTGFTPLPGVLNTAGMLNVTWIKGDDYPGEYGTDYVVETSTTLAADSWAPEPDTGGNVTVDGKNAIYTFPSGPVKFARLKVMGKVP